MHRIPDFLDPLWVAAGIIVSAQGLTSQQAVDAIVRTAHRLDVPAGDVIAYVVQTHSLPT